MIAAAPSSAHPPATAYRILYLPSVTARMNGATAGAIENGSALAIVEHGKPVLAPVDGAEPGTRREGGSAWVMLGSGIRHLRRGVYRTRLTGTMAPAPSTAHAPATAYRTL